MSNTFKNIKHIVVLMMENRSFDNMLGWQYGLPADSYNLDLEGEKVHVWPRPNSNPGSDMTIPDPDPGELFTDMNFQIFGKELPTPQDQPDMSGFLRNYAAQAKVSGKPNTPSDIMHCYPPEKVPATSTLAKAFGISDRWHASAPCQTWPNRLFTACGTAGGYVNNMPVPPEHKRDLLKRLPFRMPTIFNQTNQGIDKGWRVYFHDISVNFLLSELWDHLDHFHLIERFKEDVENGELQPYTFIEPRYFPNKVTGHMPNDSHPPYDVTLGEELIADVYNVLRANQKVWEHTLFVVTYDEHGGCYDHCTENLQSGSALTPDPSQPPKPHQYGFQFDRFGVRVPTLLISPYIEAGSIHRAPLDSKYPFDHTTIIKSVKECFDLEFDQLTDRDGNAPSLAGVLSDTIVNEGPEKIAVPSLVVTQDMVAQAASAPLTEFQEALHIATAILPEKNRIKHFLEKLEKGVEPDPPSTATSCEEAFPHMMNKVSAFLDL